MDLSDEQLLTVFEKLDDDDDGYVSMESLLSFAESGGHSDLDSLRELDTNGDGLLDFHSFAKGVKRMTGNVPETPKIGRRKMRRASEPTTPSFDLPPVSNKFQRNGRLKPSPLLKRASSLASTPDLRNMALEAEEEQREHMIEKEMSRLDTEVRELNIHNEELEELNKELTVKVSILEKRCTDYESQLSYAEEASSLDTSHVEAVNSKLKSEKEEMEIAFTNQISRLEDSNAELQAEISRLKAEAEANRRSLAEQQKTANQYKVDAFQLSQELESTRAEQQAQLEEAAQQAQHMLVSSAQAIKEEAALEVTRLQEELASVRSQLSSLQREYEASKTELENEVHTSQQKYEKLEKALRDPREYNRMFLKEGLQIAQEKESASLAAELNGASRDDLMDQVRKSAETNDALRAYVDRLLAVVIEKVPEILEVK
eukprot:TRINITY_DN8807_c0_g1_i4.p1 TRINITY_DN8807_c0_g1~~TRINITY_DN8807_c0_g1_i4.p1  ORF type:complete len:430 (+),score=120.74 TRINITY_DN8807_c0_g1_i4:199-1488(+)